MSCWNSWNRLLVPRAQNCETLLFFRLQTHPGDLSRGRGKGILGERCAGASTSLRTIALQPKHKSRFTCGVTDCERLCRRFVLPAPRILRHRSNHPQL